MPSPRILEGPEAIAEGVRALNAGSIVAFPTETVYGLGTDATNTEAVDRVFALKGRPANNPLIVHVSGPEMARTVTSAWPNAAQQLANAHWPGPLTLVLPKSDAVPASVTANGDTVAVRCPDHPVALALIESFGKPIVGPSANPSGRISPTTADHVALGFPDQDLVIIDGGPCRAGIESTVLDLTTDQPTILRPGVLGPAQLTETLGTEISSRTTDDPNPKAPGLLGPHYQPRTPVALTDAAPADIPPGTVLIAHSRPDAAAVVVIPADLPGYAANLYAALHRADARNAAQILVETPCPPSDPADAHLRDAIMERLTRAAS